MFCVRICQTFSFLKRFLNHIKSINRITYLKLKNEMKRWGKYLIKFEQQKKLINDKKFAFTRQLLYELNCVKEWDQRRKNEGTRLCCFVLTFITFKENSKFLFWKQLKGFVHVKNFFDISHLIISFVHNFPLLPQLYQI